MGGSIHQGQSHHFTSYSYIYIYIHPVFCLFLLGLRFFSICTYRSSPGSFVSFKKTQPPKTSDLLWSSLRRKNKQEQFQPVLVAVCGEVGRQSTVKDILYTKGQQKTKEAQNGDGTDRPLSRVPVSSSSSAKAKRQGRKHTPV